MINAKKGLSILIIFLTAILLSFSAILLAKFQRFYTSDPVIQGMLDIASKMKLADFIMLISVFILFYVILFLLLALLFQNQIKLRKTKAVINFKF